MIIAPQPPALLEHREDYNRANNTDTGSNWRKDFSTQQIATNRMQHRTSTFGQGRNGAWQTWLGGYHGGRLLTPNVAVEAQLIAPVGNAALDNITAIGMAMPDVIGAGMVLVYFAVTINTGSAILTYSSSSIAAPGNSSGQTGQVNRSSGSNVAAGSLIRIERRMYSATQSNFQAFVNGAFTIGWNDSTGVVPATPAYRRWFVQTEGNQVIFPSAVYYSPAVDWVRAYDLKA